MGLPEVVQCPTFQEGILPAAACSLICIPAAHWPPPPPPPPPQGLLFSKDFKQQCQGVDLLRDALPDLFEEVMSQLDLLFRCAARALLARSCARMRASLGLHLVQDDASAVALRGYDACPSQIDGLRCMRAGLCAGAFQGGHGCAFPCHGVASCMHVEWQLAAVCCPQQARHAQLCCGAHDAQIAQQRLIGVDMDHGRAGAGVEPVGSQAKAN